MAPRDLLAIVGGLLVITAAVMLVGAAIGYFWR